MGGKSQVFASGRVDNYKLVVFGSGAVGKSSLVRRFVHGDFSGIYIPTVEDVHRNFLRLNNRLFNLTIVDTSGTHDFPAMKELSITECSAFILVLAINDKQSLEHFKKDTLEVLQGRPDARILVVGNKIDIPERTVSSLEVTRFLEKQRTRYPLMQFKYVETSAKYNVNVQEVFNETVRLLRPSLNVQRRINKTKAAKKLRRLEIPCTIL